MNVIYTSQILKSRGYIVETRDNLLAVINHKMQYDELPAHPDADPAKGYLFEDQRLLISNNSGLEPKCEAMNLAPCLKDACPMYISESTPPVCREYQMAFRK